MTKKGVWGLQDVRDEYLEGNWTYQSEGPYELYTWGSNVYAGTLSQGNQNPVSSPIQIPGTDWSDQAASNLTTLAIKTDGTLWVWGANNDGALGINKAFSMVAGDYSRSSPVQLPGTNWDKIGDSGAGYTGGPIVVTKTDGTLWAWALGTNGQLGQNDTISRSSPVQIPGTQWGVPNVGAFSISCLKTDGTLWSWGYNNFGQLGFNDIVNRSSPTQIQGTQWSKIAQQYWGGMGIKTNGTLWTWGKGTTGFTCQNDTIHRSSPTQVPGANWSEVASGSYFTGMATKTDGTLWTWGANNYGILGVNQSHNNATGWEDRSSPIQIPGTQWLNPTFFGGWSPACKKTDGTLWVWGYNGYGNLAINDILDRSSPHQVTGTEWTFRGGLASMTTIAGIKNIG